MLKEKLPHFLADTWWFAVTKRMSDEQFLDLVRLRASQGFTAAQLVVGIPPEVGVYNEFADSKAGRAWDMDGTINEGYLEVAKERVKIMNDHGLTAVIYGGWGQHIDWTGADFMCKWWETLVETFDDMDVVYCLSGEMDLCMGPQLSELLLPDKTGKDLDWPEVVLEGDMDYRKKRYDEWEKVLVHVSERTTKPIIIHPWVHDSGYPFMERKDLLAANTFQTGHDHESRTKMWKFIMDSKKEYPGVPAINLEYYYEGIRNDFYGIYQLWAFWLSVAAGAHGIVYGAQGIWNVGDGDFLSHWSGRTFEEAFALETPALLGKTFHMAMEKGIFDWEHSEVELDGETLKSITRSSASGEKLTYIPEIETYENPPKGTYFDVATASFVPTLPEKGHVVIFE